VTTPVLPTQLVTSALASMLTANMGGTAVFSRPPTRDVPETFVRVRYLGAPSPDGPPLTGDGADVCTRFCLDCVGRRQDQAQALGDRARARVVSSDGAGGWLYAVTVAGWRCSSRRTAQMLGVSVEGQPGREIFVDRTEYELDWTPD
jgi:hypothetical protein